MEFTVHKNGRNHHHTLGDAPRIRLSQQELDAQNDKDNIIAIIERCAFELHIKKVPSLKIVLAIESLDVGGGLKWGTY